MYRGVGEVVSRDVHGLDRGDGAIFVGTQTVLQTAQVAEQGGLVTAFRGDQPHGGGELGQRLYEAGTRHDAAALVPLYLRPTEAELKFGRKT